jgi:heme-degrading monooxygenase HmoA
MVKIQEKHADQDIVLMQSAQETLLLHETEGKTIFQAPRKYEVLDGSGSIHSGFVVILHVPVREEGRPIFEYQFKEKATKLEKESGLKAHRLLRPLNGDTYLFLTVWENGDAYSDSSFANDIDGQEIVGENQSVLANPTFITQYGISEHEG